MKPPYITTSEPYPNRNSPTDSGEEAEVYASGVLDETRHFFYTQPSKWQVVEERVDNSPNAERQFVWGIRYVDEILERDRDTTNDATFDERLYGVQDANWNLAALCDSSGVVTERYAYTAYGESMIMSDVFTSRSTSNYDWCIRFGGYFYDSHLSLHHVRNRVSHVELGIWLQRDPHGYADGPNLYAYVYGSPLDRTDPFGTAAVGWVNPYDPPVGVGVGGGPSILVQLITGCVMGAVVGVGIEAVIAIIEGKKPTSVSEEVLRGLCAAAIGCFVNGPLNCWP
ncbi:MAG TPA: RHS repeat-associated core domain-containing protein [Pirellulaceae bacterium]|nr:RHS repeat-associated core domain-containing protein [Pirellulaceae bacterium]